VNRRCFLSSAFGAAVAIAQSPQKQRHVVLISIDGFAAYSLKDPTLAVPALRRLIAKGAVAEGMQVVNPAVTWPNHTSMVTGVTPARHSVLYNGLAVRTGDTWRVEPWVDKPELVKGPTIYDAAHAAGLTTAEVDWVAIHNAKTITWAFPERPRLTDPIVKEMIAAGHVTEQGITDFPKAPITFRDEVWTVAGEHIIEKHRPNLLLWHLLTTDSSQHRYGARSLGGSTALELADARIARLQQSLQRAGIADRTTIVVVSDHGFKTYRRLIQLNAFFKQKGLKAWTIPEGGTAMVYVSPDVLDTVKTQVAAIPGVAQVLTSADFDRLGYPQPSANERMPNLVVAAADGHSFGAARDGDVVIDVPAGSTPGAHGYLSSDPEMNAIFVASGAGIKPGSKLPVIKNLDVAPTIAKLLGLSLPGMQGRVLTEILA
jgi:predicted AlkP superfamily pyrophosphatase or phosphodiesterase